MIINFSFLKFSNYGVRAKLAAAFMAVVIGILGFVVYFNSLYTYATLTHEAKRSLEVAAARTVDNLDLFLTYSLEAVKDKAHYPIIGAVILQTELESGTVDPEIIYTELSRFLIEHNKWFTSYALLDKDGEIIFDTQSLDTGIVDTNQLYFQIPFQGYRAYMSPIQKTTNDTAFFYLSAPIHRNHLHNEVIGVLRIKYNVDILQEIIAEQNDLLGPGSFAVLIDRNFSYIAHGSSPEKKTPNDRR